MFNGVKSETTLIPGRLVTQETSSIAVRDFVYNYRHNQHCDLKYKLHGASISQLWREYAQSIKRGQWWEAATPTELVLPNSTRLGLFANTPISRRSASTSQSSRKLSLSPSPLALSRLSTNAAPILSSQKPG